MFVNAKFPTRITSVATTRCSNFVDAGCSGLLATMFPARAHVRAPHFHWKFLLQSGMPQYPCTATGWPDSCNVPACATR